MMYKKINKIFVQFLWIIVAGITLAACSNADTATAGTPAAESVTPVTITSVKTGQMEDAIDLNATSTFLLRTDVKANTTGYLTASKVHIGQFVHKGALLFTITTKEAKSLGNVINELDSSFHFNGTLHIHANSSGYITQLNRQAGDYVQDGESIATISDISSFVFLLNLPYELKPFMQLNKEVNVLLPDGTQLMGFVSGAMPAVDSASQTQNIIIKINNATNIPENLVAKVHIIKSGKPNATMLVKKAVLSDETQTQFWVMKMFDSTTAIKIPVVKGMETDSLVEIISPTFSSADRFVVTGNYGLPDTAKVKVVSIR